MWIKIKNSFVKIGAINFIDPIKYHSCGKEFFIIYYKVSECDIAYKEEFDNEKEFNDRVDYLERTLLVKQEPVLLYDDPIIRRS